MSQQRLERALNRWWKRAERARWQYGILGRRNADGTVSLVVSERPDFVHITLDTGTLTQALNKGSGRVPLRALLPVRVREENGVLLIDGENTSGLLEDDPNAPGTVYSVNGLSGDVTLDPDDLDDTATTNKFTTQAEIDKLAGIAAGAEVNVNADWSAVSGDAQILNKPTIPTVDAASVGAAIHGSTAKTTPVDADTMPLIDSAASNVLKKVTWANVKATLKTYFDTLYTAINTAVLLTGNQTVAGDKTYTGIPVIGDGTTHAQMFFNGSAGSSRQFGFRTAGVNRWFFGTTTDAESGSNTGTNFQVASRADDGSAIGVVMSFERATRNVGIGTASPDRKLVVEDTTASVLMSVRKVSGAEVMIQVQATFGAIGTITNHPLHLTTNNTVKASILANGDMGLGTTSPQGKMHVHDGTGGMLFVSKTGIVGSAQTIIPDGTGDVTKRAMFIGIASSSFPEANMIQVTVAPGGNVDTTYSGGVLRFSVSAGGALTVIRQSGASTFSISGTVIWQ